MNTNSWTFAKHEFEKDFFKQMNNIVFGKTMETAKKKNELTLNNR